MATENLDGIYSYPAAADYRTNQYNFVTVNSSGRAALVGTAGVAVAGVLHNAPDVYTVTPVQMARVVQAHGVVVKVKLGGTVAVGGTMSTNATGKAVTSVTSGHIILGYFLQAGVSGDIVSALFVGYAGTIP